MSVLQLAGGKFDLKQNFIIKDPNWILLILKLLPDLPDNLQVTLPYPFRLSVTVTPSPPLPPARTMEYSERRFAAQSPEHSQVPTAEVD